MSNWISLALREVRSAGYGVGRGDIYRWPDRGVFATDNARLFLAKESEGDAIDFKGNLEKATRQTRAKMFSVTREQFRGWAERNESGASCEECDCWSRAYVPELDYAAVGSTIVDRVLVWNSLRDADDDTIEVTRGEPLEVVRFSGNGWDLYVMPIDPSFLLPRELEATLARQLFGGVTE